MDTVNRDELTNRIIEEEKLLPGDKISYEQLCEISNKYGITPYILATNIFGVTQAAYNGLKSKSANAKSIIILKQRIPKMIEDAVKLRENILRQENLSAGSKINYNRLVELAIKYGIREKVLAMYVFEIPETSYRSMKQLPNRNAIILNKKTAKKSLKKDDKIERLRQRILMSEKLKAKDRIDYKMLVDLSKKYEIPEKTLALEVLEMSHSTYAHMRCDSKRTGTILKNYLAQDNIESIKRDIIEKEGLTPYEQINYNMLLQLANKYSINERILALDILGLTQNQYTGIKYNNQKSASILKSDYEEISLEELRKLKREIFEKEKLQEGFRISIQEIETLQGKYNIPLKVLLHILGITSYSYNFIKAKPNYKAIVKDTEIVLITQILSETIDKNRYYSKDEIEQICQSNNISLTNFFDYVLGKAVYFGYEQYKEALNSKGRLWIGDKHSVSEEFAQQNNQQIQYIAEKVSKYVYQSVYETYRREGRKLDKEDLLQETVLYILTQCGDLEKNFDGAELRRMIYLRTRIYMLKSVSLKSKVKVVSTTSYYQKARSRTLKGGQKDLDLELVDTNADTASQAIENIASNETTQYSVIGYLSKLLEEGYDRDSALNKTASTLGVDKERMLEEIKKELLKRGKVKQTKKGEFVLGDE